MLFAVLPFTIIYSAVFPFKGASSLSLVVHELAFIALAISPDEYSLTVHLVLLPSTLILFSVRPYVFAETRYLVVFELASIGAAVRESQTTISMLFTVHIEAFVFCTVWPLLYTFSMLLILVPLTDIGGAISVFIGSMTVRLIIKPLSLVDIAISVDQSPLTVRLITLPLTIVLGAVLPHLLAVPIFHPIQELSRINCTITKGNRTVSLSLVVDHVIGDSVALCAGTTLVVLLIWRWHVGHHALVHHVIGRKLIRSKTYGSLIWILLHVLEVSVLSISRVLKHLLLILHLVTWEGLLLIELLSLHLVELLLIHVHKVLILLKHIDVLDLSLLHIFLRNDVLELPSRIRLLLVALSSTLSSVWLGSHTKAGAISHVLNKVFFVIN